MSDIKHTPGPWFAEANDSYWEVNPLNGGEDGTPFSVANVCCSAPGFRDGGLQEANARLIAAAPELLQSLNEILSLYVSLVESGDAGFWNAEQEQEVIFARSVIAKATGKEQP